MKDLRRTYKHLKLYVMDINKIIVRYLSLRKSLLLLVVLININTINAQHLSKKELIEDTRQMVNIIEECHPDPYSKFGGKIDFHLAFQQTLMAIPEQGMDVEDFWWLLSSFLAKLEDGHTYLFPVKYPNTKHPGGIPMRFKVLADSVFVVYKVAEVDHEPLIGSQVISINDIEINKLLVRLESLYPMENIFDKFRNLEVYLWYADYMEKLFPKWSPGNPVELELLKDNEKIAVSIATDSSATYKTHGVNNSKLELPKTDKCDFVFDWLDQKNNIAYIRIDKQDEFREYAEQLVAGLDDIEDPNVKKAYRKEYLKYAHAWHQRYHGAPGPDSLDAVIDGLPSFTEFMIKTIQKMKEYGTDNLIIDLRYNRGGVSLLSDILIYVLYGKEHLAFLDNDNYSITFHSELNVKTASSLSIEKLNKTYKNEQQFPLQLGDYDFNSMYKWKTLREKNDSYEIPASRYKTAKTFYKEYIAENHDGLYQPENIFVIGSSSTFSAGYETLVKLVKSGVKFIGVPPAQSGNCFGMGILPVDGLKNSRIKLNVSVKKVVIFPDDAKKGHQLNPDIPLDYNLFKTNNFDKNTSVGVLIDRLNK